MIVMVGTARDGAGGVASVIATYAAHGLFQRWPVVTLASHVAGNKWQKLAAFLKALLQYVVLLVRGRVELVHLHSSAGPSFWRKTCFALPAFACRKPVILHQHSGLFMTFYEQDCGPAGSIRRRVVRFVFERSKLVIALAPSWRERYLSIAPRANIVCIPNAVRVSGGAPRALEQRNVLFLGRISADKGVFDLIEAWVDVRRRVSDARLVIAGDGDLARARECIARTGLQDSVALPGWVSGAAKEQLLERTQVCVLPSYFEGMPMSLLEAFGHGIPCVASTAGGIPDVVTDGVEGRLVQAGDVPALAAALVELLSDGEQYARMSRAAHARYTSACSVDVVIPALEKVYAELGIKANPVSG